MLTKLNHVLLAGVVALACSSCQTEKRQRKRYKKNNGTAKEQTQEIGERRQATRKTRSKPQPNKPVKGRRTLY